MNNIVKFPIRVDSNGEPPYDGGMEARIAKLEAGVSHLESDVKDIKVDLRAIRADHKDDWRSIRADQRTDFRTTWAGLIATALGLAALMAKGFGWI